MAIDNGESETPQVYDPTLGKERDAFPGEIIPDEQQKTLNRLMTQGTAEFQVLYDAVAVTGQLNEAELNGILKAGKIRAEQKRLEYLEAIRTNPANLVASVFKKFLRPFIGDVDDSLTGLDDNIANAQQFVDRLKNADKIANRTVLTNSEYTEKFLNETGPSSNLIIRYRRTGRTDAEDARKVVLGVLDMIGALPPNVSSIEELYATLQRADNPSASNLPYVLENQYTRAIVNLPANSPQFEGIRATVNLSDASYNITDLVLRGSENLWTRIIDIGAYTPTQKR